MANIKSQKKRNITNAKAAERNKATRSELKSRTKTAVRTIGDESNDEAVRMRGTCSEGFLFTGEAPAEQIFSKPFAEIAAQSMS